MDGLPIELLRFIFEAADRPSVRSLRLVTPILAQVGYEYLIPPSFTALGWRDDIKRLDSIAAHDQLRSSIQSITLNFSEINEYNARHASYFQHYLQEPEERTAVLTDAWARYADLNKRRRALAPFNTQATAVKGAFHQLPNLRELVVTFCQCPFDIDVMQEVFQVPNCRKMDYKQACKNMNAVVTAMQGAHITSFTVDRLPMELFKTADDRRVWFECSDAFSRLTHLSLTLDWSGVKMPASMFKAVNGLGYVLRRAPNLTHLSLAFHNYSLPKNKFLLWFSELLDGFTFLRLTDLQLESISCDEADLSAFLDRHAATLERLRLGGRGLAKGFELAMGGVHLFRGSFKSLFEKLHHKALCLQRLHLEGDFESEALEPTHESYDFHPTTDEYWNSLPPSDRRVRPAKATIDSSEFEAYVLRGGDYPGYTVASTT